MQAYYSPYGEALIPVSCSDECPSGYVKVRYKISVNGVVTGESCYCVPVLKSIGVWASIE